jgi:hypothetical protein
MRVMLDREKDIAYVQLKDVWEANPDGGSYPLLPPPVPDRIDIYWDGEGRVEMISIVNASKRLHPDALKLAVPFERFPPMPPGSEHTELGEDWEAEAIARRTARSGAALQRMLDNGYPGIEASAWRQALDAAEAEAAERGIGFAVAGVGELPHAGFDEFIVVMVSGERRGVIRAGVERTKVGSEEERRADAEVRLLRHLRAEQQKIAPYDAFDLLIMHLGPVWFSDK